MFTDIAFTFVKVLEPLQKYKQHKLHETYSHSTPNMSRRILVTCVEV